jgi:glucose/arabinose dehydrogenase
MFSFTSWMGIMMILSFLFAGCEGGSAVTDPGAGQAQQAPVAGGQQSQQPSPPPSQQTAEENPFPYMQEVVADHLNVPWDMDVASDGRIFFTERPGTIRVIVAGKLLAEPVFTFTDPFYSESESGLLGIVLDRNFAANHYFYVYHTYQENNQTRNRVLRMVEKGNKAVIDKVLIDHLPGEVNHDGGRIKIGPDGLLYITAGDALDRPSAQDVAKLGGKILRIGLDGSIPKVNPFPGSPVYSLGHRNPQGLAWNPLSGKLFSSEHGQSAHDEINLIEPGANYGWPLIEGDQGTVAAKDQGKLGPGTLKKPLTHSGDTTWAPSGITFVSKGPWKGNLLVANLRGEQIIRVIFQEDKQSIRTLDYLFKNELGRVRNVYEAADGSIYVMTNNRDGRGDPQEGDDRLIRWKPRF